VETGTGQPRVEAVYGYLVRHDQGLVLFDTGLGVGDEETEDWYRPRRADLRGVLAAVDVALDDVRLVANCHLHFDHCGGNPLFRGTPLLAQRVEFETARRGGYTFDHLVDFAGASYELLDGEAEILPGLWAIPTPGHVDGHQALVAVCADGSVVVAGQSHGGASEWSADVLAADAAEHGHDAVLPVPPAWLARLLAFDPKRVVFAHDAAEWRPPEA
jgi:glyoxylase-like metal-dependent hydrolase (beta-lactamase superfamily II)